MPNFPPYLSSKGNENQNMNQNQDTLGKIQLEPKNWHFSPNSEYCPWLSIALAAILLMSANASVTAQTVRSVRNIFELVALTPVSSNDVVFVQSYRERGDGGGGFFVPTNTISRTNLGTRISSASVGFSWDRVYSGAINVQWFGADGSRTKVRNATRAIQDAIDTASFVNGGLAAGSAVYIPGGTYWITNLLLHAAMTIYGDGMTDQTVLKGLPGSSGIMVTDSGNAAKINIRNLQINGNNEKYASLLQLGKNKYQFGTEGIIDGLWIRGIPSGIALDVSANVGRFQNITVQDADTAFRLTGNANKVSGIVVMRYYSYGLYLHTESSTFVNTHLEANLSDQAVPVYVTRANNSLIGLTISLTPDSKLKNLIVGNLNTTDWVTEIQIDGATVHVPKTSSFGAYLSHQGKEYGGGAAAKGKIFSYPK